MHLLIAIIDQDDYLRSELQSVISAQLRKISVHFTVHQFHDIHHYEQSNIKYDILFLNTRQKEKSPVDWMRMHIQQKGLIMHVYYSKYKNDFYEASETLPLAFIRCNKLIEDAERAFRICRTWFDLKYKYVLVEEGKKQHLIIPDRVLYLVSDGHYIDFHLHDGKKQGIRCTMERANRTLEQCGFVRIHDRYIINKKYIQTVSANEVILRNEERFRIGNRYKKEVQNKICVSL